MRIATSMGGGNLLVDVLPWLALLAGLVIAGAAALYLLKRAFSRPVTPPEGFSLQELRDLRAARVLSEEEFERAKASLIERVAANQSSSTRDHSPPYDGDSR